MHWRYDITGQFHTCRQHALVCGKVFDVAHALSCKKGGFVTMRHNEVRDITANILNEVCRNVQNEPVLQPLTGEILVNAANRSDEARLDITARDFWIRGKQAFFDVRVFNPFAKRHLKSTLNKAFEINEKEKKIQYNSRVQEVESGSFTPLVFSTSGGMSKECATFYTRLANLVSEKRDENLSIVSAWLKTRINFSLIRSTLLCLRGSRSITKIETNVSETDFTLAVSSSKIKDS